MKALTIVPWIGFGLCIAGFALWAVITAIDNHAGHTLPQQLPLATTTDDQASHTLPQQPPPAGTHPKLDDMEVQASPSATTDDQASHTLPQQTPPAGTPPKLDDIVQVQQPPPAATTDDQASHTLPQQTPPAGTPPKLDDIVQVPQQPPPAATTDDQHVNPAVVQFLQFSKKKLPEQFKSFKNMFLEEKTQVLDRLKNGKRTREAKIISYPILSHLPPQIFTQLNKMQTETNLERYYGRLNNFLNLLSLLDDPKMSVGKKWTTLIRFHELIVTRLLQMRFQVVNNSILPEMVSLNKAFDFYTGQDLTPEMTNNERFQTIWTNLRALEVQIARLIQSVQGQLW